MIRYRVDVDSKRVDKYLAKRREASIFIFKTLEEVPNEADPKDEILKRPSIVLSSADKVHTLDLDLSG